MKEMIYLFIFFILFGRCLSYKEEPRITLPKDTIKSIEKGKHFTLTCEVSSGSLPFNFEWKINNKGISVKDYDKLRIEEGTYTSTLSIDKLEEKHSGNYTCRVSNDFGSDIISVILKVQVPPKFDQLPKDTKIGVGQRAEFYCSTHDYPQSEITWNKLSNHVTELSLKTGIIKNEDASTHKVTVATGNQWILDKAKLKDSGIYECLAHNPSNGLSTHHIFTVLIDVPPHFNKHSSLFNAKRGENVVLNCETLGTKPIKVKWKKADTSSESSQIFSVDNDTFHSFNTAQHSNHRIVSFANEVSDKSNTTLFQLHIKSVEQSDAGVYLCEVANDFGENEKRITLKVQDVPSAVENVEIEQLWSRSASIHWSRPKNDGNSKILRYIIQYWKENTTSANAYRLHEQFTESSLETFQITNKLSPGTAYVIRIIAESEIGRGEPSKSVKFETKEEEPSAVPVDINVESKGTTSLRIKWKAPLKNHWNGQLKGYYIGYKEMREDDSSSLSCNRDEQQYSWKDVPFTGQMSDNYFQEYYLTSLFKAGVYCIMIRAYNEQGNGPLSQPILASTSNQDPPNPPLVRVTSKTERSLVIKWEQLEDIEDLNHYLLFYKDDQSSWLQMAFPKSDNNQYELTNLQPSTWYKLYMKSVGNRGSSEPSSILVVKTADEIVKTAGKESVQEKLNLERTSRKSPLLLSSLLIIPVIIATTIIVIVCVIAYAYIKHQEKKVALIQAGYNHHSPNKSFHYISTGSNPSAGHSMVSEEGSLSLRYNDTSDKSRPLLARPSVSNIIFPQQKSIMVEEDDNFISPYGTLIRDKESSTVRPPLPKTRPPVLSSDNDGAKSFTQNNPCTSSNIYFKADVHYDENNDRIYDHFQSHRV